ncbi:hypothetical protein JCM10207_000606 [Rhodosporidiobolus poonsookiae]
MASTAAPPDSDDLSLAQLLTRSLRTADQLQQAPAPNDPHVQSQLSQTLSNLALAASLIQHLAILSPNETLDDIATRDLRCLLVEAQRGQLSLLVRTRGGQERLTWLNRAKDHFLTFLRQVEQYEVVPPEKRQALAGPGASEMDSSRRRAGKIAQFKMEKEIKGTLEVLRHRRRTTRIRSTAASSSSSSSSSTPAPPTSDAPDGADDFLSDSDDDSAIDVARPLLLNLLTLHYLRAHAELGSLDQEVELLEHGIKMSEIPSPSPHASSAAAGGEGRDRREKEREDEEDRWRLDATASRDAPVLSPSGKVLRPFTILPSSSSSNGTGLSTRLRLQSEVFRPSHRLPTMTIDEYLAAEEERGNVLQGGGPSTSEAVEQARAEERAEEEEDTRRGYEREEQGLRKVREWDDWTDTHRKGEGNMHNRG